MRSGVFLLIFPLFLCNVPLELNIEEPTKGEIMGVTKVDRIVIPRPFDRHLHLRDGVQPGEMLHTVLPCTLAQRMTGAVIMGNLAHPHETSNVEKA